LARHYKVFVNVVVVAVVALPPLQPGANLMPTISLRVPMTPTHGNRIRLIGLAFVVVLASVLAELMVAKSTVMHDLSVTVATAALWIKIAGGLGAALGLILALDWLGGRGFLGVFRALVGFAVISAIAILTVTVLLVPLYGLTLPRLIAKVIAGDLQFYFLTWTGGLTIAHFTAKKYVQERASIFTATLSEPIPPYRFSVLSRLYLPETLSHQQARWAGY
jgi:hypothetical protein